MSNTETETKIARSNFASRILTKQLNEKMKTSGSQVKINPADAAKYAVPQTEAEKETVTSK